MRRFPAPDPSIEYVFPTLWERIKALMIDYFIVAGLLMIIYYLVFIFWKGIVLSQVYVYIALLLYRMIFEFFTGTTIGKKRFKMRVVDSDFKHPGLWKIFKRNSFYIVFIGIQFIIYWFYFDYKNDWDEWIGKVVNIAGVLSGNWMLHFIAITDLVMLEKDPSNMNRTLHDRFSKTVVIKIKPAQSIN